MKLDKEMKVLYLVCFGQLGHWTHWNLRPLTDCSVNAGSRREGLCRVRRLSGLLCCPSLWRAWSAVALDRAARATGWALAVRGSFECRSGSLCCRLCGR